jgi:hypothetical protein
LAAGHKVFLERIELSACFQHPAILFYCLYSFELGHEAVNCKKRDLNKENNNKATTNITVSQFGTQLISPTEVERGTTA